MVRRAAEDQDQDQDQGYDRDHQVSPCTRWSLHRGVMPLVVSTSTPRCLIHLFVVVEVTVNCASLSHTPTPDLLYIILFQVALRAVVRFGLRMCESSATWARSAGCITLIRLLRH